MSSQPDLDMPLDFVKRIHRALRAYHAQHTADMLGDLLLARQMRAEQKGAMPRLITNRILVNGLDGLKQIEEKAAELLQRRFLNQETALEVAHNWNMSEDIVFQRQRAAIAQLGQIIWTQEQALRRQRVRRIEARLEPSTYTKLFGAAEKMAEVRTQLETTSEPWLISLEGLGGIGKTSLADALARDLAREGHFEEIGWVSVRRHLFRLSGNIETLAEQPVLTLAELVDRLIDQFELTGLKRRADDEKMAGLKEFLRSQTCLVVIDNLEAVIDYGTLISQLWGLAGPSKFLLTTRYSLHNLSGVYIFTLKELSRDDTLALIRHEAETRGLAELAGAADTELAQIYTVTGGNPLATKLLIGQIQTLSLSTILNRFQGASSGAVEELLTFIYAHAWQTLDPNSRRVLQAMLLITEEGGRLEQIAAAVELDEDQAATCLQRLAALSLVNVGGSFKERRYSLHQLTHAFLSQQPAS